MSGNARRRRIGAGHNGLVAAAYLARAGLDVEVFERRDVVGGACVTEELWPGVRASPAAYTLSLLRPEIIRELDLAAHGLQGRDPRALPVRSLSRRAQSRHVVIARADRARNWSRTGRAPTPTVTPRGAIDGSAPPARARPLLLEAPDRERWPELIGTELLDGSIADELAGIPSEQVRVPFAIQGLIGTLAGPDDPGTAFVAFYHDLGEAAGRRGLGASCAAAWERDRRAPRGRGGGRCARARGRAGGADLVDGGRAGGMVLAGGGEVAARSCCRMPTRGGRRRLPACRSRRLAPGRERS